MFMTAIVRENALVESLVRALPRSSLQRNGVGESDAELVRLPGSDLLLAITNDAIVEEIEIGLYRDPYLIGWVTVVASASDLAAVGADPVGILLSQTCRGIRRRRFWTACSKVSATPVRPAA